jgi:hypothetical protein
MSAELITTTLFANGLLLEHTDRTDDALILRYVKHDRFGCKLSYLIAFADGQLSESSRDELVRLAARIGGHAVVVGASNNPAGLPAFKLDEFLGHFGGAIPTLLPFQPTYDSHLRQLGENSMPAGLKGKADVLYEDYVAAGLQFLLGRKVISYGRRRSGEAVPDGIALRGSRYLLYDAKAASKGFKVTEEEMRKFADYVTDFSTRYGSSYRQPQSFLIVSTSFLDSDDVLQSRSRELFSKTSSTVAAFITSDALLHGIQLARQNPTAREGVDWNDVFCQPVISKSVLTNAFNKANRDELIQE